VETVVSAAPDTTTPAVEREIALDIVRHGAYVAPVIVLACGLVRGWDGVTSSAIGVGLVFVNFLVAAAIMTRAGRVSPTAIGIAACAGYVVRLGIILVALIALRHQPWIDLPTLGIVLVGTHLGLLFWEMKYLAISLGAPALKPAPLRPTGDR
jgi:hypothetical protein